jgi:hypothetical protein
VQLRVAWEQANASVQEAEARLSAVWSSFAAGQSGPPSKELLEEIARLRRECDARLKAILDTHNSKPAARYRPERPSAR